MTQSLDTLRRDAKTLMRAFNAGDLAARQRVGTQSRLSGEMRHADALHVVAREAGFATWPALKEAAEAHGLDRATRIQRLKIALFQGHTDRVVALLDADPGLAEGHFALQVALLNHDTVAQMLAEDPTRATTQFGPRRPMCHLAFSRMIHVWPEKSDHMLAIAELLLAQGADVNDTFTLPGEDHPLSALYGAIGQANNLVLGEWLLERGANPNDGESLYHATEHGHREGLRLLLQHGANPKGTNALFRAMDFDDADAVTLLLSHGAGANDLLGEAGMPALHHAARRMCQAPVFEALLEYGADVDPVYDGVTAYELARIFGNKDAVRLIRPRHATSLTGIVQHLAKAADGVAQPGAYINPNELPTSCAHLIRDVLQLPGRLDHVKHLVALGVPFDAPDEQGFTPLHVASWNGLLDIMHYLIRQMADLAHVNSYGGTLLSTIIHGSDNCAQRADRDYLACLELALTHGVALPRAQIALAGRDDVRSFLKDWAQRHPGQVI